MPLTAYQVGTAYPSRLGVAIKGGQGQSQIGPILFGGSKYDCYVDEDLFSGDPTNPGVLAVAKSTNNGVTWTELDTANAPTLILYEGDTWFNCSAYYPPEGGRYIYFVYLINDFSNQLIVQRFDMMTDAWGSPSAEGPQLSTEPGQGAPFANLVVRTGGDYVVFYKDFAEAKVSYAIYNGAWGTPVPISDAPAQSSAVAAERDTADNILFLWNDGSGGSPPVLTATTLSSSDVLSSSVAMPWSQTQQLQNTSWPVWIAASSLWIIGLADLSGNVSVLKIADDLGTFSLETIDSPSVGFLPQYPRMALFSGVIYCAYNNNQDTAGAGDGSYLILYRTQVVGTTTWSSPAITAFDAQTDTLSPAPETGIVGKKPQAYRMGFTIYVDGTLAFSFGTINNTTTPDPNPDDFGNVQYYVEIPAESFAYVIDVPIVIDIAFGFASAGAGLAISCPVGGSTAKVGIFYSAQVVVTGGVPPYTFAITSGSLPPGLTLDPATGIISGTPTTTGTYNYEVQVTDSLGSNVAANCSITVSTNCPPSFIPGAP